MPHETSPLRVLVVDDEPLICWSLAETLRDCGDLVTEAESGEAAIRGLQPDPDVVLLDYHLSDSHDLGLLSKVRRLAPHSRVILMTAHWTPELAENALAIGASDVISKTLDVRDVPALVHDLAGGTGTG